jgi:hypothetical protein
VRIFGKKHTAKKIDPTLCSTVTTKRGKTVNIIKNRGSVIATRETAFQDLKPPIPY